MMHDMKHAIRQLFKSPGFTCVAVLALGLCVGANLTIFAVLDAVVVRPLPFPESDRLVVVHNAYPGVGIERGKASIANYFERREAIDAFESVSLCRERTFITGRPGSVERVVCALVTPEFFQTLGVPLAMGQTFTDAELDYGTDGVAIITDRFWRNYFNGDIHVLGRTFYQNSRPVTVIGVLPAGFRYLSTEFQIYRPMAHSPEARLPENRHGRYGQMIARLAEGRSIADAQAELKVFNVQELSGVPNVATIKDAGYFTSVASLRQDYVRAVSPVLLLLQTGVSCLLLIGGVNVAGLLFIRASSRTKEFAVRQALGAGRWHIARTILTETMMLSLAGGVLGIVLTVLGLRLILLLGTDRLPLGAEIAFDSRVAVVSILTSIAVGICIALPIIWLNLRGTTNAQLQSETRGGTSSRSVQHLRNSLIVCQIAVAFVLLCGAGLLGVSLKQTLDTSPGFESEQVLTAGFSLTSKHIPWHQRAILTRRLLSRLRAIPGVTHAALSTPLPFATAVAKKGAISTEQRVAAGDDLVGHYCSRVSTDYFRAMGIPLREGRFFEVSDDNTPQVAIIDEAFANQYWPNGDAIGRRFTRDAQTTVSARGSETSSVEFDESSAYTVVGIVGNVKHHDLTETEQPGSVYLPYTNQLGYHLVLRTSVSPASLAPIVQETVRQIDPELPLNDVRTMQGRIDDSLVARRSPAILAGVFASVALLLAAIGTYGVLAYAVAQRRREIGIRIALGAMPKQIGGQFMSLGLRLLAAGTLLGGFGAWVAGRAMQNILFDVPAIHLPTFAGTAVVMSLVTFIACLVPALRATRVDPIESLRTE